MKDRELDYTSAQRSQVAWQILVRCAYDRHDKEKVFSHLRYLIEIKFRRKFLYLQVGIRRLLNNQTYLAAYPLHEGSYNKDPPTGAEKLDRRVNLCVAAWNFFCLNRAHLSAGFVFGVGAGGVLAQTAAAVASEKLLRGQNRAVLCVAGILHQNAGAPSRSWISLLCLRVPVPRVAG